jgi:transposase-like protein
MNQTRSDRAGVGVLRSDHYAALLSEQERSGQSVRAFALARGLSPLTLYGWRRKLGRTRRRGGAVNGGLVAVDVVEHQPVLAETSRGFEVLLANGSRVRVPLDFEAGRLAELLTVLRTC